MVGFVFCYFICTVEKKNPQIKCSMPITFRVLLIELMYEVNKLKIGDHSSSCQVNFLTNLMAIIFLNPF